MMKNEWSALCVNNGKGRNRRTAGFTMAELLIVVAIIGVLAAVSFIAVQSHQKSMTQLQYDTIAKEIFVAAQNHLTLAKSENYQDTATAIHNRGTAGQADADKTSGEGVPAVYNDDIYYFTNADFSTDGTSILDQMLPFGSVELVTGGRFIIRYQPNAARVLDVFYWTNGSGKYDANLSGSDYATLVGEEDSSEDRHKNYTGKAIVGWFGGEKTVETGDYLQAPEVEVINAEMLLVTIKDKNTDSTLKEKTTPVLKLIVTGNQSGAKVAIPLDSITAGHLSDGDRVEYDNVLDKYTFVLDDVTSEDLHFSQLTNENTMPKGTQMNDKQFLPGENITIQAVAYSNTVLTSVAYSGEWTTNSLFDTVEENSETQLGVTTKTAKQVNISNIRHLENLNKDISSAAYNDDYFNSDIKAVQTVDLDWDAFKVGVNNKKGITGNPSICVYNATGKATKADCFFPVSVPEDIKLDYNGQYEVEIAQIAEDGTEGAPIKIKENHSIKGIVVDNTKEDSDAEGTNSALLENGGVFGNLTDAKISNLALINTRVKLVTGHVGALVGKITQSGTLDDDGFNVSNVVAYNTSDFETALKNDDPTMITISTAASGDAGGLIGSATNCTIQKSAAALIVSSTGGNAGGLIGTASGGTVSGCYSGGHTIDDPKGSGAVIYSDKKFNVTAVAGYAGGLIGDAGTTEITNSYSTCSATGKYAGGFVGKGDSNGSATNCYATGLVLGGEATTKTVTGEDGKQTKETTITEKTDQEGAFAYSFGGTVSNCKFFEIINERDEKDETGVLTGGYTYLPPIPNNTTLVIDALDENAASYNDFSGAAANWKPAVPYDAKLIEYYGGKYNMKTIEQLIGGTNPLKENDDDTTKYFVATHYGDWPAPEIFVVNTKKTSS